jgi:hypothetical protein
MEMPISEAFDIIKRDRFKFGSETYSEAMDIIKDTVIRYQNIQNILNEDFEEYNPLDRDPYRLSLIRKEVKGGKRNN